MLRFVPEGTQCFVVMDLEWNQHASRPNHAIPHEIIEIGAVKLDRDLRLLDERQYIIKPVVSPVLDTPIRQVTGLDPEERVRFRNLLCEIAKDRIVLLSTHIVEDIEKTCKNIAILNEGRIVYHGTLVDYIGEEDSLEAAYMKKMGGLH